MDSLPLFAEVNHNFLNTMQNIRIDSLRIQVILVNLRVFINLSSFLWISSIIYNSSVQAVPLMKVKESICQIQPTLKIITPEMILKANNVTVNEETRDIFVPGEIQIILECISSFPVDFDIDAHLLSQETSIETNRKPLKDSDSDYCYGITAHIKTTREATGQYSCRSLHDPKSKSEYYIYANGENPPFLLHGDSQDSIKLKTSSNDEVAILPCVTTNPNVSVALYRVDFQDFHLLSLGSHLTYNPKVGFSLHLKQFPDPYGKYKCVASSSDYFDVFVHVLEPDDEDNSNLNGNEVNAPKISLNTDNSFGTPYFICDSSEQVNLISSLNCRNPVECRIVEKCLFQDVSCSEPHLCKCLYKGHHCSKSYRAQKNITGEGCSSITYNLNGGVVQCSNKNQSLHSTPQIIRYFRGLSGSVVTDREKGDTSDILRVATAFEQADALFYVGEEITFLCTASRFVFSKPFQWLFKLKNGTFIQPNVTEAVSSAVTNNEAVIREDVKIIISDPNIEQVICIAPVWNETTWLNATETLIVKDSKAPIFFDPTNITISVSVSELNHTLPCAASGFPNPDILWLRNGQEFLTDYHFDNSVDNITSSFITLKDVSLSDDGFVYTCNASNPRGMIFKTYTVIVYQNPTLLVFSLTSSLVIFCLTLLVLLFYTIWRRLRVKNRGYTFHFSRLDVDEFEQGNPEAVKKCSDEYQKALYLPYDKKMEIQPEHLITDYSNILGQGEFGVVLKGKLVCNIESIAVAVKTTKDSNTNHLKSLLSELKIRIYIGNHENVVNLLGAVTKHIADRNVSVVYEYCQYGSMEKYLRSRRNTFLNEFAPDGSRLCTSSPSGNYVRIEYLVKTSDLILWAYQIAKGMEYLSSKKVIHGDLAARNILLTENHTVKITDFGLSKHLYNYASNYVTKKNDTPMPWRWLSLEALRDQIFSVHSDIWAYGVTLWELFSLAETPHPSVVFNEDFINNLIAGQRLGKPKYSNFEIYRIMKECWRADTNERPSFSALKYSFYELLPPENYHAESETDSENQSEEVSRLCLMNTVHT